MIRERDIEEFEAVNQPADTSQRTAAIIAGLGLLLMVIPAVFANFFILETLVVPGDAATTANNILSNELSFRMAFLSLLLVIVLDVVVAWALYVFFKPVNKSLSLLAGWFRLVYAAIFTVAVLDLVTALQLLTGTSYENLFEADQLHSQMMLSINAFTEGWAIGLLLFGLHLILLGYLAFKSGYMSKILGILVIIAGIGYVIDSVTGLILPDLNMQIGQFTFIGELLLAFWLLIKGGRVAQPQNHPPESA